MIEGWEIGEDFNLEAEQAVLGCFFLDNELLKETMLKKEYFYHIQNYSKNGNLFATMKDLADKRKAVDTLTVAERLKNNPDNMAKVGGIAYMAETAAAVPHTKNFDSYVEIIVDHYKTRQRKELGMQMQQGITEVEADQKLKVLSEIGRMDKKRTKSEVFAEILNDLETADGVIRGAKTGLQDIDLQLNGFHRQEFIVVGARPSMGKTAYAVNIMTNAARSVENPEGAVIGFFAAEQPEKQLMKRVIAKEGRIELEKLRIGKKAMKPDDWTKFTMASGIAGGMDFEIFDKAGMDMNYIRRESRQLRKDNPEADIIIIIDYLQMIKGNPVHRGNRTAEVGEMSQDCKLIARELDCTVIALAQLSRSVEQRQDKRPMMSDLRDSGEIEQAADVVQFLYRDEYYDAESEDKGILEVITAKQREGSTGSSKVFFEKEIGKLNSINWGTVTKAGHVDDEPLTD